MNNEILFVRLIEILYLISTFLCLSMVIAQNLRSSHWLVRMFDFPVKQLVIVQFVLLLVSAFTGLIDSNIFTILTTIGSVALIFLLYSIWPYTPLHPLDIKNDQNKNLQTLHIMSANVFMDNTRYDELIQLVREQQPDCLLLLETDAKWEKATEVLDKDYPYQIKHPLENTYGLLFFSKLKMKESEVRFLLKSDIPSIKVKLEVSSDRSVLLYGVHPEPPSPTESETSEPRDIELLKLANEVREINDPIIFAGDFNDVAWSHTTRLFRRYSGLLDPRIGRGSYSTFHVKYPLFRWPLDHFFLSSHFTLKGIKVLSSIGSDHFPISIKVNLPFKNDNESPKIEKGDLEEVSDKMKNEKEHKDV